MAGGKAPINVKSRLLKFGLFLFAWALILCGRLIQLQIVQHGVWTQRALRQQQRTVDISPQRGVIYDRNGQELAMTVQVDSVFAVPSEIPDPANTVAMLASILDEEPQAMLARIQAQKNFAWVARKVDPDIADRIRSLNLRGIYFQKELKRFYPKRTLAAQVLGYVGMEDVGLAGIEHLYQDQLNGQPGKLVITMDARRKWFGHVEHPPDPGDNVVLTIDEKIQYIVEKELAQAMEETHAVSGTVVVQNTRTGEILALANAPTFNPNNSHDITPDKLKNHAVSDVYEPGSVFKTVTFSSAFDEGVARPEEIINCDPGYVLIGGIKIHDSHHIGTVTLEKAYAESSDVGAVRMALRLGPERFYKHMQAFGFGQSTNIELPGETRGLVRPPARWAVSSIGSMSIGQEVGVTPLQIVSMMSSVANDGIYSPPRIVASVTPPGQGYRRIEYRPQNQRRVLSSMTSAVMRRLTEEVVLEGTARRAILDGYSSAGKTGTAQKIDPKTHAYSKTDYVASFVGFTPVNNPAITIAVILDSPKGLHQGGQVSAPVFKRVAEQVLSYLGVPHDVEPKVNYARRQLVAHAAESDTEDTTEHQGSVVLDLEQPAASPQAAAQAAPGRTAPSLPQAAAQASQPLRGTLLPAVDARGGTVVLENGGHSTVPSLLGLSMRGAIEAAHKAGYEVQVVGSGLAREQQPPPGTYLPPGSKIAVRFAR
ncbi:MAG: penicillin-binding protein [Acidobacteriota bacterium]|nr:penicillin-binding protein [Acidobacteriota bacterium]